MVAYPDKRSLNQRCGLEQKRIESKSQNQAGTENKERAVVPDRFSLPDLTNVSSLDRRPDESWGLDREFVEWTAKRYPSNSIRKSGPEERNERY